MRVILPFALSIISISCGYSAEAPLLAHEYDALRWPEAVLQIDQQATLKNVFDSGLRPYRYPGLESSFVEVKHLRLIIRLASKTQLPLIEVEKLEITPFDDGEIATIEGFTPKLTLKAAKAAMLQWIPYGKRTPADLDQYLKAVEADFLDFDDPYRGRPDGCAMGWTEPGWKQPGGGAQCRIWFRKAVNEAHPLRLYFNLSWVSNRLQKNRKAYSIPIPPPPGYEHVSMSAPVNFGPDSEADILRAAGRDIGESIPANRVDEPSRNAPGGKSLPEKRDRGGAERGYDYWPFLLCGLVLVLMEIGRRFWSCCRNRHTHE